MAEAVDILSVAATSPDWCGTAANARGHASRARPRRQRAHRAAPTLNWPGTSDLARRTWHVRLGHVWPGHVRPGHVWPGTSGLARLAWHVRPGTSGLARP